MEHLVLESAGITSGALTRCGPREFHFVMNKYWGEILWNHENTLLLIPWRASICWWVSPELIFPIMVAKWWIFLISFLKYFLENIPLQKPLCPLFIISMSTWCLVLPCWLYPVIVIHLDALIFWDLAVSCLMSFGHAGLPSFYWAAPCFWGLKAVISLKSHAFFFFF